MLPAHQRFHAHDLAALYVQLRHVVDDEFVAGELNTAKGLATEGDEAGALTHLAQAMHPVMDQTSPEHVDANGQPKAWGGVASPGAVGHAIREHFDRVTPAIQKFEDQRLQAMYISVFGKPQ